MPKKLLRSAEEYAQSIKASFAFEGLELSDEMVERSIQIIKGEISSDEVVAQLIAKYKNPQEDEKP